MQIKIELHCSVCVHVPENTLDYWLDEFNSTICTFIHTQLEIENWMNLWFFCFFFFIFITIIVKTCQSTCSAYIWMLNKFVVFSRSIIIIIIILIKVVDKLIIQPRIHYKYAKVHLFYMCFVFINLNYNSFFAFGYFSACCSF